MVRGNDGIVKDKETASYDLTVSFQGYGTRHPAVIYCIKTWCRASSISRQRRD